MEGAGDWRRISREIGQHLLPVTRPAPLVKNFNSTQPILVPPAAAKLLPPPPPAVLSVQLFSISPMDGWTDSNLSVREKLLRAKGTEMERV